VKFLKELKEETSSRSRLKHLLVLLARILAIIFLVLAFAQPFIPAEEGVKVAADRAVSIYLDNSFSMEGVTREGTLLEVARRKAREIALAYKSSDRFQLLTNDFEPVQQRLLNREDFLSAVELVKVSPAARKINQVISRQTDALNSSGAEEKRAIVISDFQESMVNTDRLSNDTLFQVTFVPVAASEISNVFVDSCWFTAPVIQLNNAAELNVRLRNSGEIDVQSLPVKMLINGTQKAVASADIASGNYADITLTFTVSETGWQKGEIIITDNPITFDDRYYFSFLISKESNLLSINGPSSGKFLQSLFKNDTYFRLNESDEKQIDYSSFNSRKVIFVNSLSSISSGLAAELTRYTENGGTLVIIPDSAADLISFGAFYRSLGISPITALNVNAEKVSRLMLEDPLFTGVFSNEQRLKDNTDYPVVNKYFIQADPGSGEMLMQLRSGLPFMTRHHKGKGEVYTLMAPLSGDFSNFARHAIFVPVIYRLALLSEKGSRLAYFIGRDEQIELPSASITGDATFHLVNENLKFDVIPAHRVTSAGVLISINNQVIQAGNYELMLNDNIISMLSYNFNRDESVMRFYNEDALQDQLEKLRLNNFSILNSGETELTRNFSFLNEGIRLWKYCVLLVLLFLATEIILLKFWKQ
jgi:hypothetical protein